jgi:nitrite reductase (NADH) large subunit
MDMTNYLIIGNGAAGTTAAENIRKQDKDGNITIVTDEDIPFYYRPRLMDFLSGESSEKELIIKNTQWYKDREIVLKLDTVISGTDQNKKEIMTASGEQLPYDRLLLATGSRSFIPPIKGSEKSGVFALRHIKDARNIIAYAEKISDIVLIGGGLLGLEAGNALRKLGKKIKVVEFFPRLLPRQLDQDGADRLKKIMEKMGFLFWLGAKTEEITGEDNVTGVKLEGDETLDADMVIISAGVRPNMDIAASLGLVRDKGIKVNERLLTNRPKIYAAGDVAEFRGMPPYGIWPAAMEQGKIAGINMAGGEAEYEGTTMANTLKVVGIDLASAGDIDADNKFETRVFSDDNIYKKIVLDNNRIIGCIMMGQTSGFNKVTKAMAEKKDVSKVKDEILDNGFDFQGL